MGLVCMCVHACVHVCTYVLCVHVQLYVNADTCLHMCKSWRITLGVSPQFLSILCDLQVVYMQNTHCQWGNCH